MDKETLKAKFETEQERCFAKLAELEPGTEEHSRLLYDLHTLAHWLLYDFHWDEPTVCTPAPVAVAPADSEPAAVTATFPIETPAETQMKKEDVRAALADARMKGVDVGKLISSLGAANLTAVDPADYPKLMDALAKELEGK